MHFIYSDSKSDFTGAVPLSELNKNTMFRKHLENFYYLKFISENKNSTFSERHQANKELEICERKMKYWSRFPDFDQTKAIRDNEDLRKNWKPKE